MVYEFAPEMREIALHEINSEHVTMGFITLEELRQNLGVLGIGESTLEECESDDGSFRGVLDLYDTYSFGMLYLVNLGDIMGTRDRIGVYLKKNFLLLVEVYDEDKKHAQCLLFCYCTIITSKWLTLAKNCRKTTAIFSA